MAEWKPTMNLRELLVPRVFNSSVGLCVNNLPNDCVAIIQQEWRRGDESEWRRLPVACDPNYWNDPK